MSLRKANETDEDFLLEIRNQNRQFFFNNNLITKQEHHDWFTKEIMKSDVYTFVFETPKIGRVGTITLLEVNENQGELGRFMVFEKYRGRGFSKLIFNAFTVFCKKMGLPKLILYVINSNSRAIVFYLKRGFKIIDCEKDKIKMEYLL